MQRTLSVLIGLVVLLTASAAFAEYPKYLGGDRNYILCDGHMGVGFYVDRSSLNVQKYDRRSTSSLSRLYPWKMRTGAVRRWAEYKQSGFSTTMTCVRCMLHGTAMRTGAI